MEASTSSSGQDRSEYWHSLLSGEDNSLTTMSRFFKSLPGAPRCKLCMAPFAGPVAPFLKLVGFRPWALNQQVCTFCLKDLDRHKGGAELPVSLLFADVRGSTQLAETMSPTDFRASLDRFFAVVSLGVDSENGLIDNIVGDGVMAMWIPGFVGPSHAEQAVAAGRRVARDLQTDERLGGSFPAGVAVHTGMAYVGVVGEKGSHDFTVLGDPANTVARLGAAAEGGELVLSDSIVEAAGTDTHDLEHRTMNLKGKADSVPAWIEKVKVEV